MNDLLGRPIKKDDLVLINRRIFKVVSSHANSIKFTASPNGGHITSTGMFEKVLVISDFDNSYLDSIISDNQERINILTQPKEEESIESILEQKRLKALQNENAKRLKQQTVPGSIISDKNNTAFLYLGKQICPANNKSMHTYFQIGYTARNQDFSRIKNNLLNVLDTYSFRYYGPIYINSLKIPDRITNEYKDEIINHFTNTIFVHEHEQIQNNYNFIKSCLGV